MAVFEQALSAKQKDNHTDEDEDGDGYRIWRPQRTTKAVRATKTTQAVIPPTTATITGKVVKVPEPTNRNAARGPHTGTQGSITNYFRSQKTTPRDQTGDSLAYEDTE